MKYGNVTLGQVEAVWNKLGGVVGVQKFLADELAVIERDIKASIPTSRLRLLGLATLVATNGQETIAQAKEVFPGFIDPDFKNWGCDVTSESTPEMPVALHELVQDGDFRTIFTSLGTDLDKLCLTQPQIIQFCRQHQRLLSADGHATFFLFKANNVFFVANVRWHVRKLRVYVRFLSIVIVWNGESCHRVVVPQLTPVTPGA